MAEHSRISAPATAASEGDHLFVWLDDNHSPPHEGGHHHHHHHGERPTLTFFGTYTSPAHSDDERPLEAKGTLTFESLKEKFAEGDHGKFKVTKKKDGDEHGYDVEVFITYIKKDGLRGIEVNALFKGKGDLREGEGIGEWKLMTRNEKK